jgi:hypothetical protein
MLGTAQGKIAAAGEQFAPTAAMFGRDAKRVTGELGQAAFRLADRAGPGVSQADAGTALQRGGESFVNAVKDRRSALYGAVDQAIPKGTGIASPETVGLLEREIGKLAALPNISKTLGNGKLEGWLTDLKSGNLTWEAARALRTEIGEAVGSITGPTADMAQGRLKAIYGALSKDLDAAASAAGPEAAQAWRRANTFTRLSQQRIDTAFGKVLGKNITPEKAYDALTGMALEGGPRSNTAALRNVFHSLPKEDAAEVAGTIIRRLGRATAGAQDAAGEAFSADTFLTNWNKMSKPARAIIGRSGFDPSVGEELTKLAGVVERAKEAGSFRNRSNTGNAVLSGALGASAWAAPISTAATAAVTHLSARALTNHGFLRALNDYAAKGQAGALLRIARSDSPLAMEAATILRLQVPETTSQQPR